MDHNIPLQLRYFELHLNILTNRSSQLPNSIILFYQCRNQPAIVLLHHLRSAKAAGESEVVFISMDHICAGDGLSFEVCIHGDKTIKGFFRQRVRWRLEKETIKLMMETKISVVTDQRFLASEKVGSKINRFYPKLTSILDDDDEDDDDENDDDEEDVMASDEGIK